MGKNTLTSNQVFIKKKPSKGEPWYKRWQLYLMLIPGITLLILFSYVPMVGIVIAFQNFKITIFQDHGLIDGFFASEWVGLKWFEHFFSGNGMDPGTLFGNTLRLSIMAIVINTPLPIMLALLINEIHIKWVKRVVQTISYAPYFISTVVICGMCSVFLYCSTNSADKEGLFNVIIQAFGGTKYPFLRSPEAFPWIYVLSGVWQGTGWAAIIYVGSLGNVDKSLHEAAQLDGASRWQRIIHINVPHLLPLATIMFILAMGSILTVGFDKVILLRNSENQATANIISTYVYDISFNAQSSYTNYSLATAIGLFNSVINLIFLLAANFISKKVGGESLW